MARPARRPAPARPTRPPPNSPSKPAPRGRRRTERKKGPNREAVGALLNVSGNGSTGASSGTCPAHKAASKQPIEAQHHEGEGERNKKKGPNREAVGALLNVRGNGSTGAPSGTCPAHKAASQQPIEPCATRAKRRANGTKEGPQPGSGRGPFKCKWKWLDRGAVRHLPGPQGRLPTAHRSPAPRGRRRTEQKEGPQPGSGRGPLGEEKCRWAREGLGMGYCALSTASMRASWILGSSSL